MQRYIIFFLGYFLISFSTFGQRGNSPYSAFGIGDLVTDGGISHVGMGGIGVATSSPAYLPLINPALLVKNKLTCFEAGGWVETKNLLTNTAIQRTQTGSLGYIGIAFPITNKWTASVGVNPYSSVNYFNQTEKLIPYTNSYALLTNKGSGGINQAYIASGFTVIKNLYVGGRLNFNFGSLDDQAQSFIDDGLSIYKVEQLDRNTIQDFSFKLGAAYRVPVGEEKYVNFGLVYDLPTSLGSTSFRSRQRLTTVDVILSSDTLSINNKASFYIPPSYQFGVSFEKSFYYNIGIDVSLQDWASYKNIDNSNEGLARLLKVKAGAEITPNPASLDNYLARVTYRVGVNYTQLPVVFAGKQLEEQTVSAGMSFPVARGISAINTAFVLGTRGTTDKGLIQENFFRVHLGVTINDQWFMRRRIN